MNTPGPEHFIFIPGVLLVGMVIGYILGARAARAEIDAAKAPASSRRRMQGVARGIAMFDFEPTEEQHALIETARRFARERIIPIAAECDRESQVPAGTSSRRRHEHRPREPDAPGRVRRARA